MTTQQHIARHLREFIKGKNWTWVWFDEVLQDVTWEEAVAKVDNFNTIAVLVFHMNYYTRFQIRVFNGGGLEGWDRDAFRAPDVRSAADWEQLLQATRRDTETLATLVEQMPAEQLDMIFLEERYGSFYRNLHGNIEHMHYHLGQIVLLKKQIRS